MNTQNNNTTITEELKKANTLWIIGVAFIGIGSSLGYPFGLVNYGMFVVGLFFFLTGLGKRNKILKSSEMGE